MVTELSFVCFWQLQVYPLTNARPFFLLFGCYEFLISYCCLFYGLGKIAKMAISPISKLWVFVVSRSLSRSFVHNLLDLINTNQLSGRPGFPIFRALQDPPKNGSFFTNSLYCRINKLIRNGH